jgi:hypothetical protein
VLYVDDMLVSSKIMVEIAMLKTYLARNFKMKYLGRKQKKLGIKIHRDRKHGKLNGFYNRSMWRRYL